MIKEKAMHRDTSHGARSTVRELNGSSIDAELRSKGLQRCREGKGGDQSCIQPLRIYSSARASLLLCNNNLTETGAGRETRRQVGTCTFRQSQATCPAPRHSGGGGGGYDSTDNEMH